MLLNRTISPFVSETQIPRLWVPSICHYKKGFQNNTEIDIERNNLHLSYLSDYIGGYLVNGSTGDGWTLNALQQEVILKTTLDFMHSDKEKYMKPILIGALAHDYDGKQSLINKYLSYLYAYYGNIKDINTIYKYSPFIGFAITPPSNTNNQKEIEECLSEIIELNKEIPFVLYQLPQITNSEMSIDTVKNLISRFGNIIMIKDSSGTDQIVKSGQSLDGVFMVRGAEGNQIQSLMNMNYGLSGYNGLLLSTANNYAEHLNKLIINLFENKYQNAQDLSDLITKTTYETFQIVGDYNFDNPFTNSAKMVDFFIGFGNDGEKILLDNDTDNIPITKDGIQYNVKDLMTIKDILTSNGILHSNVNGYITQNKRWYKKQ